MTSTEPVPAKPPSRDWGCLGMAVAFLLVGLLFGGFFAHRAWRDLRIFTVWRPATCNILSKEITSTGRSGKSGPSWRPAITFRYSVEGREYNCTGWDSWSLSGIHGGGSYKYYERVLDRYQVGGAYPCWYDPSDPSLAVLTRRIRGAYLTAVLPLVFTVLGAAGLFALLVKPTPPRATALSPPRLPRITQTPKPAWDYPRLPVRLAPDTTPGTQSCLALAVALALLFVGGLSGYAAWDEWSDGSLPWFLLLFTAVFGGLGLLMLRGAALAGLASRVPRTILEAGGGSAEPGEEMRLLLIQPGPVRLRSLELRLVGEELTEVPGRSPDVRVLHDEPVIALGPVSVPADRPLEQEATLRPPAGAAPSREGEWPRVRWRLQVLGVPRFWPRFLITFPITVRRADPGRAGSPTHIP